MFAVTKSIKFQNKLAKEVTLNALKSKSASMFNEGMILRCFMNVTENSIEIFNVFKNKEYVNKARSSRTNQFWHIICSFRLMGIVIRSPRLSYPLVKNLLFPPYSCITFPIKGKCLLSCA